MTTERPVNGMIRGVAMTLLALAIAASGASPADAGTKQDLERARDRLSSLEGEIAGHQARLQELQGELDALAATMDEATSRLAETQMRIAAARNAIRSAKQRYVQLRRRLEGRARMSYELGVGGMLSVVLESDSLANLADRVAFVDNAVQSDADLGNAVRNRATELDFRRQDLRVLVGKQSSGLEDLRSQESALASRFADQQAVADGLGAKQSELAGLVDDLKGKLAAEELARARAASQPTGGTPTPDPGPVGGTVAGSPFRVCPVGSPHAYVDSFGAPRVGHVHAGNDLMSPEGTPIYAPFSGQASSSNSSLGGISVYVYGAEGYVFNAHLSRVGQLGSVSAGTVVGYVGSTGNAAGGSPHDHFEWHPKSIPSNPYRSPYGYTEISGAIDPFPYLNQVC
jgi:murein DD-endopeptidase MepM/ murein hydrolase activator NlpD